MGANQQMLMGEGGATKTYATWNPSDKDADVTLSNGNKTARLSAAIGVVRSTVGVSSGKWYWEVAISTTSSGGAGVGVAEAADSLSNYFGSAAGSYTYSGSGSSRNNSTPNGTYGAAYATGDVIGVGLDLDAGMIIFYKNGVSQGIAYSGLSGTFFAAVGTSVAAGTHNFTANFGATALTYTPPAGYNAGLYT